MKMMIAQRHYEKPPITEAIIDLRVELPPEIGLTELNKAHGGEEAAYPIVEQRLVAFGEMRIGPQISATASSQPVGYLFRSADGKQIYQARLDGFAMSRLAPYENWNAVRDEARRLWDIYRSIAKPSKLIRLAVRYINRIECRYPLVILRTTCAPCQTSHPTCHKDWRDFSCSLRSHWRTSRA